MGSLLEQVIDEPILALEVDRAVGVERRVGDRIDADEWEVFHQRALAPRQYQTPDPWRIRREFRRILTGNVCPPSVAAGGWPRPV